LPYGTTTAPATSSRLNCPCNAHTDNGGGDVATDPDSVGRTPADGDADHTQTITRPPKHNNNTDVLAYAPHQRRDARKLPHQQPTRVQPLQTTGVAQHSPRASCRHLRSSTLVYRPRRKACPLAAQRQSPRGAVADHSLLHANDVARRRCKRREAAAAAARRCNLPCFFRGRECC
jgi:hypothetical protein